MSARESFFTDIDHAKHVVDAKAAEMDQRVLRPAKDALIQAANNYPFSMLFAATFLVLSIFPLVAFLGFAIFTGSIILFLTLSFFAISTAIVIGSAAVLLAGILAFAFAISIGLTLAAASIVVGYRLLVNVKASGSIREGSRASIQEVKQYLRSTRSVRANGHIQTPTLDAYVVKAETAN